MIVLHIVICVLLYFTWCTLLLNTLNEMECVYCAVRAKCVYVTQVDLGI
jgi:hypothetical protein